MNNIRIEQYEQARGTVSIGGIKWDRKWDVCVQFDDKLDALRFRESLEQKRFETLEALAKRLALDLECLLLDPVGWYRLAHESLQSYRDLMDKWYPQEHVSPFGKD